VIAATDGFETVAVARSGEQALELLRATQPDLVLLDLRMPGMGGTEVATRIGAARPATAVVLMTADPASSETATTTVIDKRALSPATLAAAWDLARS
jgi:CheY-like chemotaxis protein